MCVFFFLFFFLFLLFSWFFVEFYFSPLSSIFHFNMFLFFFFNFSSIFKCVTVSCLMFLFSFSSSSSSYESFSSFLVFLSRAGGFGPSFGVEVGFSSLGRCWQLSERLLPLLFPVWGWPFLSGWPSLPWVGGRPSFSGEGWPFFFG